MNERKQINEDGLNALKADFTASACDPADLTVFVIDEASFLVPQALEIVDLQLRRLCNEPDIPFGGIVVILAGDFWQKPPPGGVSLAEQLVAVEITPQTREDALLSPDSTRAKGLAHFRRFRRTVLSQQMRAAEDPQFQAHLLQLRNTEIAQPVPEALVRNLKAVSADDVRRNPAFRFATIAVLSNYERHRLNRLQATAFAEAHDLPLLMWKRAVKGRALELMDDATTEELYENEPGLWEYFLKGAYGNTS